MSRAADFATARGRLSREDYDTIRQKRLAGVGIQNIANMLGCSTLDVHNVLGGESEPITLVAVPRPDPSERSRMSGAPRYVFTAEDMVTLHLLEEGDIGLKEAVRRIGCSITPVRQWMAERMLGAGA